MVARWSPGLGIQVDIHPRSGQFKYHSLGGPLMVSYSLSLHAIVKSGFPFFRTSCIVPAVVFSQEEMWHSE